MKIPAFLATILAAASLAHATTSGLDLDPLGDRNAGNVGFAFWDVFTNGITFSNIAADVGDIGLTLSQSAAGSGAGFGPFMTDYFYTSTKATEWTISGSASAIDINTVVLQIKLSSPTTGAVTGFFSPTLNGSGATPVVTASGIEPGGLAGAGYNIVSWTWTNLDIASGAPFTIAFSNSADGHHVAIDGFSVDVAAVPEPATYGLLVAWLIGAAIWRRRNERLAA